MMIGLGGLALCILTLSIINSLGENPISLPHRMHIPIFVLLTITAIAVLLLSGFTPAALTQMADIAESQPGKRGAVMGLYSVVLGVGQLTGAFFGGFAVDRGGFYGLMIFSTLLGALSLISVLYMRAHGQDHLRKSQQT
jgi:predicted MFS family arabinose efflux permease